MNTKRLLAVVLAWLLVFGLGTTALAQNKQGNVHSKNEIIYGKLTAEGGVESLYTVNHFHMDSTGAIKDYGSYDSVLNLTDTNSIGQEGDAVLLEADEEDYYYQGNMTDTNLPWLFDIQYSLDGKKIAPKELAGASGFLAIEIVPTQNGTDYAAFYDYYMLQITITLDTAKASDVSAPEGVLASAGKNQMVTFTAIPGMEADFVVKAEVKDFEMEGISIAGMPFAMDVDLPDMEEELDELSELPDAIAALNKGVEELKDGTADMLSGAEDLTGGSDEIAKGLKQLDSSSKQLLTASSQIKAALSAIASAGGGAGDIDLSQVEQLPAGLRQLSAGIKETKGGLVQLKKGFVPAYQALDQAVQSIPSPAATEQQLQELYAHTDPSQYGVLGHLIENYTAAQTVKGTYAQVKAAFDAVGSTVDAVSSGMDEMAGTLDHTAEQLATELRQLQKLEQLDELFAGLSTLSRQYGEFHQGLVGYAGGVQKVANNYDTFHNGIAQFEQGIDNMASGTKTLYEGTTELDKEVADMPDKVEEEIEKLKEEYMPGDFEAVSFLSDKNEQVELVQFVLMSEGIEKPEVKVVNDVEQTETFWDRLIALFKPAE